jgi:hypothetical protein
MKKIFIHIGLLYCYVYGLSQVFPDAKRDANWLLGYGSPNKCLINFNTPSPLISTVNNSLSFLDMTASISDTLGNLLFYTNGYKVMNKNHQLMDNGDSLNCCMGYFDSGMQSGFGFSQGVLILPKPKSDNLYYIFHEPLDIWQTAPYFQYTPILYYSIVDMSANNGLGKVIQKNVPVLSGILNIGMLTACRHANGRDWWLLIRRYQGRLYHRFLLSPTGVEQIGTQLIGDTIPQHTYGQTVFSPDGTKLAIAQANVNHQKIHVYMYDFDRCTGLLSGYQALAVNDYSSRAGCAFSPSSQYLYVSSSDTLYQYNIQNQDWASTQEVISYWTPWWDSVNNVYGLGFLVPALDKVYMFGGIAPPISTSSTPPTRQALPATSRITASLSLPTTASPCPTSRTSA